MSLYVIIATVRRSWRATRIACEMTARLEVRANSLSDAYKAVRALPEFKFAHLRPE